MLQIAEDVITDDFYYRLAWDYVENKKALREFMRLSPAWDEDLQAWVINGNRTHEPDKDLIYQMAVNLLKPAFENNDKVKMYSAALWFSESDNEEYVEALLELAPKANLRQKKSKVFIALCKALGVWQDSGKFQIDFSKLCNEFNSKKIDYKFIVSIHPAHFLTMSNPHATCTSFDKRKRRNSGKLSQFRQWQRLHIQKRCNRLCA